jgi:hypothetical protein
LEHASLTLAADAVLLSVGPHMHVRGKSMDVTASYDDGRSEALVHVPRYDFNWQLVYELGPPKHLPRGTRLDVTGRWDNSEGNRFNPNAQSEVRWGDQSWEEMLIAWLSLEIDPSTDVDNLFQHSPSASAPAVK